MEYTYVASLDIGSESMACCVLSNIEGDMAASLVDLQENGPAYVGDERGAFYPLMDGDGVSSRLRTRFALVDGRTAAVLPDAHAELELIARPHVRGGGADHSLFRYFFRDEEDASLGANKWLPNPKIIYQLAAKGYLPPVLDQSGQPLHADPDTLLQHLITQVVRNFVLQSSKLGGVDVADVDLILTVPNAYSLPHTQALSEFVQDHTHLRGVRVVQESDAIAYYAAGLAGGLRGTVENLYQFGGSAPHAAFIQLLRQAYQNSPATGVYIVTVDIGRGTADLSLVHVAWPETQHEYHVLARTGSNKAGNQLSYTLAQYYSAQLRAAYEQEGLTQSPELAEHLWDFCSLSEQSRSLDRQQGYALDLLQRLIGSVKRAVDERYSLDARLCPYDLQRGLARRIADCVVQHLGAAVESAPELLGAAGSPERARLRDALAEALILPVGTPLGAGDPSAKLAARPGNWFAGLARRVTAREGRRAARGANGDIPGGRPRTPVLDMAAWYRLGEDLRDQAETSPRALLQNLDKAGRFRHQADATEDPRGGMTPDNTLVVLAGQGSQFRPLQATLREACRTVFGCPDDHILALSGREAKEACCWGALSFVLQRPVHIGASALHGTYGFLDAGLEGFVPVDMAALNRGDSSTVAFRYPGFRTLVFTPRAVETVEELGQDYAQIIGFSDQQFTVARTPDGLQVNGRDVRLPVEGQALAEEEMLAKLWPEQIARSAGSARKRSTPRPPPELEARPAKAAGKRKLNPGLPATLLLVLLLAYPAHSLIPRHLRAMSSGATSSLAASINAGLTRPPDALLASLVDGPEERYATGSEPASEDQLAQALLALPLHQRLLKVGVATVDGRRMALIKLQAGDLKTGLFRVTDLEQDAVSALRAAFAAPLDLQCLDLWTVVPGQDATGPIHRPIFSVFVERSDFTRADRSSRPVRELLGDLGMVRFAPQFLQYAGGQPVSRLAPLLPDSAWSTTPVSATWDQVRAECNQDRRLTTADRARVVVHIPVRDNSVALTIDDGPHPLVTPLFLDILRRHDVHATFFVVGKQTEEFPELLQRTVAAGHEIGNHTYSHPRLGQLAAVEALTELRAGARAIRNVCGQSAPLMRPPGGGLAEDMLRATAAADSTVVLWTHNTNDWLRPSPEQAAANALRDLRPGGIVLMHQGSMESVRALPLIIEGARERGLRLRPVGEMLRHAPVAAQPIADIMAKYEKHELGEE